MGMKKEQKIQYHPPFCAAMELELRENKEQLSYEREHSLNTKPNTIDLLVGMEDGTVMKSGLGAIFKKCNVFEYKSPGDALDWRIYHRTLGYVHLYIAYTHEEYSMDEVTVSFIRHGKPIKLMKRLASEGFIIREYEEGIYHVTKTGHVDMQIIVTSKVGRQYKWITKLTNCVEREDMINLVEEVKKLKDGYDRRNAEAVFDLMTRLNRNKEWMKEVFAMGAFRDLFKEEFEKKDHVIEEQNDKIEELQNENKQQKQQLLSTEAENSRLKEEIAQLKKQLGKIAMF